MQCRGEFVYTQIIITLAESADIHLKTWANCLHGTLWESYNNQIRDRWL